jgi:hypothetical protein
MNPNTTSPAQTATTGSGLVTGILGWVKQPFTSQGSALNWVLFVGLLIIAAWMWNHILMTISNDI